MTELTKNISLRLKIARIASGHKTSKEFAEKYAIPLSTYCQHETGKRPLSIEQLFHYAELTCAEPIWLLTGKGNPCNQHGNKQIEQKILEEQERLGVSGELNASAIPTISEQDQFSYVNIKLFKKIVQESMPLIKEFSDSQTLEAIDFCFELYNRIVTLDAKEEERIKVIKIGLKSFFEGLGIREERFILGSQCSMAS